MYYTILKTGFYFRLKCSTPLSLMSNVVYIFNCARESVLSYISMTTRHLSVTVREKSHSQVGLAVGKHVDNCHVCREKPVGVNDFKTSKTCSTNYNIKFQEILLIKKCNPFQFYANGSSFLFFLKHLFYVTYLFSVQCGDAFHAVRILCAIVT